MLKINKINVFYGDLQVLWDVSLEVEKGSIVSVLGCNGAGKTTLLKAISGLLRPRSGTVEFQGKRIDNVPEHSIVEEGIAHVPEGRGVFPKMSVLENLEMGAYTARARPKMKETMDEMFDLFPILKERKNQSAGTLSGGEQQMLAIARGLMSQPSLVMLDEPSLGLMPIVIPKIFNVIRKINDEGCTVLLVEQDVHKSLEIARYAYILETGRTTLEGPSKEIADNPHIKKAYLGM